MASQTRAFLGLVVFLSLSLAVRKSTVRARNIPANDAKLQPEWLGHFDRSVLIPGIGRVMLPPKGSHFKNFNYNPITGAPGGGNSVSIPGFGGGSTGGGSPRSYVPGGDDTLLPNPGVEVPNPVGGRVPTPSGH